MLLVCRRLIDGLSFIYSSEAISDGFGSCWNHHDTDQFFQSQRLDLSCFFEQHESFAECCNADFYHIWRHYLYD